MSDNKEEIDDHVEFTPLVSPVTEQQRQWANDAFQEFERKQFTASCNIMNKLMAQRPNDPRVVHNKAVADFCLSGFQSTDEFRQSLANVCRMAHVNLESGESLEDVDHSVLYYNQAIILHHLRQYKAALSILDRLFQFIEPLDESLGRKVLLLLVELYLCTYQPEKALGMLTYMEKNVLSGRSANGEKEVKEEQMTDASAEMWKARFSIFKTRCLLMMKSMKLCKREIKSLMNTQFTNMSMLFLKSNFEYLRGNLKKAMKMLGSSPQVYTEKGECLTVMHYNNLGCIYFQLRKHNLGAFYFRKAILENENIVKEMKRGSDQSGRSLSGRPLHSLGMSRHFELMYNMGVQLLHCGKALPSFDCLIEAVQVYQINPRLWLRLAECCIMAVRESNDDDRKLEKRLQVIQGSVGSGVHRKLILGPGVQQDKNSAGTPAIPASTMEFASLCLRNALTLLPDESISTEFVSPDDQEKNSSDCHLVQAPPGNPMKPTEVANLRCSVLAASAYVALSLNDYTLALQYSEQLLKQSRSSGAQRYLAHLYMGESLVALDRIADGIQHLNSDLVTDISTMPPEHKSELGEKIEKDKDLETVENKGACYPWSPRDLTRAKAIMQYNLASAHAIRGEYDKAGVNLVESSKYIGTPLPAQMYFLKLYLDLIEGRRKMAQFVIKDNFGHVTPNRIDVKMEMKISSKQGNNNSWSAE
ncbi:hypothetical protein CHS0354_042949 [Potamilus streckersoni]|uniref:CCR4-NOT transcription complex subunit 10 n=1 Tax=Potamilus streckersoni TaxID=2493646 RepID=A0AAE0T529_9BIVA|nr:hypothetical protein CHS0354_042949 [Potamilus streckersoni]